ncbi:uncharacterized protein J4E84_010415 [Alternaria hordeiaustralica]|uniref:uncharacterized protein n=1 Tax=Alternaria hordeiaustralica TaxID=1187925 RepID=UPI0020C1EAAC|nr:uncharacterized protein J4E84_010415 [Alternaria hordeiaustralica]KAI4674809.1 hypothetical protein J4E84_010415 [Alternaria hordeiaustralica]
MFVPAYKIAMTAKVVFTAAASFTRLSLHCFYYRLVTDSGKTWFKWAVHVNVAYTLGILISFPFVAIFFCTPIKNYWTIGAPADTCMDEGTATLICGIINCVADFLTTLTPIPLVMGLHMRLRERMAVAALFGMGLIVSAAGIVRTWFIYRSLFNNEYDQTWYAYPLWIAAAVEIDLGVICASAPVLKPLLAKIPFSLSQSLSGGISFKKSAHSSKTLTANASASHSSTNRKSTAPRNAPELANDKGNSYEMKHWADTEQDLERGSQEAILEEEEAPKTGMSRLWGKVRPKSNNGNMTTDTDMTITLTSEVELQVERMKQRPARYETHGDLHENHMPLPPLAPRSSGHDR